MRRTLLNTRPSRAVIRALGGQQPRRTFAAPSPVVRSKEQAHPVGPFYEAILRTPVLQPKEKPENPPVTSKSAPVQTPKPTPEHQQSKPVAEEKKAAEEQPAASEDKKPARRTRKPKQETSTPNSKAKSVPSSTTSSTSSSSSSPSYSSSTSSSSSVDFTPASSSPTPGPTLLPQSPQSSQSSQSSSPPSQPGEESSGQEPPSNDVQTRASVVFTSSLAGPAERRERLARIRTESRLVAGVLVPPRPEEPDNCCMSGCVNCVWDRYRDEMEEWAARRAEAERRLAAEDAGPQVGVTEESMERTADSAGGMDLGVHDEAADRWAASMDDDGGGSVGNWETGTAVGRTDDKGKGGKLAKDFWDEELYKNVPVGIREFMKQEKRLKEKHRREGTLDGKGLH
ncbi:hypothetical protein L209DRAFT_728010 [Thermothelomyces heterothallicus CBS 203.75]